MLNETCKNPGLPERRYFWK